MIPTMMPVQVKEGRSGCFYGFLVLIGMYVVCSVMMIVGLAMRVSECLPTESPAPAIEEVAE